MAQWVYGKNTVNSALDTLGQVEELFVMDSLQKDELVKKARKANIPVTFIPKKKLSQMAHSEKHQGFLAKIQDYKTYSLEEMMEAAKESEYPLIVLLDGLEDPHNLGAILRSVDAIGANGIVYAKNRSVSLNPTVAKVSTGAIQSVMVSEVTNLSQAIETLKENGYWIVGTDHKEAVDYRTVDYKRPIGLVIGSEGKGISRLVLEKCDYRVSLPMRGMVNSLNASVATGIFLYAIDSLRYPVESGKTYEQKRSGR